MHSTTSEFDSAHVTVHKILTTNEYSVSGVSRLTLR